MAAIKQLLGLGWNAVTTWGPGLAKGTWNIGKSGLKFAAKNPKFSLVGGGIAVGSMTGNGALRTWANWFGGGDASETTSEKLNRVLNGDKAHGGNVLGDTLDSIAGEGTAQAVVDGVKDVRDGAVNVATATRETVVSGVDAARGFVSDHMPSMPSMNQYADQQVAAQGQYPVQYAGQYPAQQGGGMSLSDFSPFNGFKSMLNTVTGGNTNLMSVAAMIPAAMLMFGNFGWMGKIASLMLGSLAVKNINHPTQQVTAPYAVQPQMVQQQYQQNYREQLALADGGGGRGREEEDHVVMRGRG